MKKYLALLLCAAFLMVPVAAVDAGPAVDCAAALLMEKETGTILFEKNAHDKLEPASVTKVMTLLLVMEAIEAGRLKYTDKVTISHNAAAIRGSRVFVSEGEQYTVEEMIKAICVASGNDASIAMAEHLSGTEGAFVQKMNARAQALGMKDTSFVNCSGMPAAGHLTSAYDIALMSRQLLTHKDIRKYTTIWLDSLRGGTFQLANTNKLIRFYDGATGLKTGSTDSALNCISATAERDGMELIAVVLKSPTSDKRFESAKAMLNFGFATYTLMDIYPGAALPPIDVLLGEKAQVQPKLERSSRILIPKADLNGINTELKLCENVEAPVEAGQKLGEMVVTVNGLRREVIPILAEEAVARITAGGMFTRFLRKMFMAG